MARLEMPRSWAEAAVRSISSRHAFVFGLEREGSTLEAGQRALVLVMPAAWREGMRQERAFRLLVRVLALLLSLPFAHEVWRVLHSLPGLAPLCEGVVGLCTHRL